MTTRVSFAIVAYLCMGQPVDAQEGPVTKLATNLDSTAHVSEPSKVHGHEIARGHANAETAKPIEPSVTSFLSGAEQAEAAKSAQLPTPQSKPISLAPARAEIDAQPSVQLKSRALAAGGSAISMRFSEYADGASPRLSLTDVAGDKSHALIANGPDAKRPLYWLAWNVPTNPIQSPDGLQEQARVTLPQGKSQGKSQERGTHAFPAEDFDSHPAIAKAPSDYPSQLLAPDTLLSIPAGKGAERSALLSALKKHATGKGELARADQQTNAPPKCAGPQATSRLSN